MSSKSRIDRGSLMRQTLAAEEKSTRDRFAVADDVIAARPGGLAQPAGAAKRPEEHHPPETFSAESTRPSLSTIPPIGLEEDGKVLDVPISKVHDNPLNARAVYQPAIIKERATSIAAEGQKTPANAMRHPDRPGEFILFDGHYRKHSLLYLGRETMRLILEPPKSGFEMYRASRTLNVQRNDQTALDDAIVWSKLKGEGVFVNDDDISEKLGISIGSVSKTLALLKLPEQALNKVKEAPHKFGVAMGYELYLCSKVMSSEELLKLIADIIERDLPTREVESMRKRLEVNKPRKTKEVNRIYKLKSGDAQIGYFKESDTGKVALEVMIADPKERTSLIAEIKRRFGLDEA